MTRRPPYAIAIVAAVAIGLVGWSVAGTFGQPPAPSDEEVRTAAEAIRLERRQSAARIALLQGLRKSLVDSGADAEQIAAIDAIIAAEKASLQKSEQAIRSVAAADNDDERTNEELEDELHDLAGAIGSLNQSYEIPAVRGHGAFTGGSKYVDLDDADEDDPALPKDKEARIRVLREQVERMKNEIDALENS